MKIKDLMIPVDEYQTVAMDATFSEIASSLAEGSHRDVIVVNESGQLAGVLTMADILVALEPNYRKLEKNVLDSDTLSNRYVSDIFKKFGLWTDPLHELCKQGAVIKVADAMYVPDEAEYLDEEDDLAHGIHRYIIGMHQPLLVRNNGSITGVLRLNDIFDEVWNLMLTCHE